MTLTTTETLTPTAPAILETVDCPNCGSSDHQPATGPMPDIESKDFLDEPFKSMTFQMVKCDRCGLVYQRTRPTQAEIGRFYSSEYHCYESFEKRGAIFHLLAKQVLKGKLKQFKKYYQGDTHVFLDYGCGSGTWLELLKKEGFPWQLIGTDIIPEQIDRLNKQGIDAHVCDDTNVDLFIEPNSVGIIHLFHVIEHVPNPIRLLKQLYKLLVPGGIIIGQTPNVNCWERQVFGDVWGQWHFPRHLVLFDENTMAKHAEKTGFEIVDISSSPSASTQWAASLQKLFTVAYNRSYQSTSDPLYPFLTLGFLPVSYLQIITGQNTSHMDFILRKPTTP